MAKSLLLLVPVFFLGSTSLASAECNSDSIRSCMDEIDKTAQDVLQVQEQEQYRERVQRDWDAMKDCFNCNMEVFENMLNQFIPANRSPQSVQRRSYGPPPAGQAVR